MTIKHSSTSSDTGLPCPECGTFIRTDINMLLKGHLYCPSCGLKLSLSEPLPEKTKTALKQMTEKNNKDKDLDDHYP